MKKFRYLLILAIVVLTVFCLVACGETYDGDGPINNDDGNGGYDGDDGDHIGGNGDDGNGDGSSLIFEECNGGYCVSAGSNFVCENLEIPSTYNGKSVVEIRDDGFANNNSIKTLTIPDSVKTINFGAFSGCGNLESVTLGQNVTRIGSGAFGGCKKLTSIVIPDSVKAIDSSVFQSCTSLTSVTLSSGLEELGSYAFDGCTSLGVIVIPDGVQSIGYSAFSGCTALTSVVIGNGVTRIEDEAFENCTSLFNLTLGNSLESIGRLAFSNCKALNNVVIPDSVTEIGNSFIDSGLNTITIGSGVQSIGYEAFKGCNMLVEICNRSSLDITAGSEDYGYVAYSALNVSTSPIEGNKIFRDDNGYVIYDGTILIGYEGSATTLTLPSSLTKINKNVFSSNEKITSVTIPDSITEIGDKAFDGCRNLNKVSGSVYATDAVMKATNIFHVDVDITSGTSIPDNAFNSAEVKNVTMCDSITSIGEGAFAYSYVENITISPNVTSIGNEAFRRCTSLKSISLPEGVTSLGGYWTFYECSNVTSITANATVMGSLVKACRANNNFSATVTSGTILPNYTFNDSKLASVTLPDTITEIGEQAFYKCEKLTSISLPDAVTTIGEKAFEGSGITGITIGSNVTTIGDYAFSECDGLTSFVIPDNVTSIGKGVLSGSRYITSVTLPSNMTTIPERMFHHCYYLSSITIPDSVTTIEASAFETCDTMTHIVIPDNVTTIGEQAFTGCGRLMHVTFGSSVKTIADDAFLACDHIVQIRDKTPIGDRYLLQENKYGGASQYTKQVYSHSEGNKLTIDDNGFVLYDNNVLVDYFGNQTDLVLPSQVTEIFRQGLYHPVKYNVAIASVTLPSGLKVIGEWAFTSTKITSITIPDSVEYIKESAFRYCYDLTSVEVNVDAKLSTIGAYAFDCCESLTNLKLSKSVASVPSTAFNGCEALSTATANAYTIDKIIYGKSSTNFDVVILGDVGEFELQRRKNLISVTLTDSVENIGKYAFEGCTGLTSITFGANVASIGGSAFCDCSALTSITLPASLTSIASNAFKNCATLANITFEGEPTEVGTDAFYNTAWLSSRPDGLLYVGKVAYKYIGTMPDNTSITIKDGTLSICEDAFMGCDGLTSISLPSSLTKISVFNFTECTNLTSITIDDGNEAYYVSGNCVIDKAQSKLIMALGTFTIPTEGVTSIGEYAFALCKDLTELVIPDNITDIDDYAFGGCTQLASLTIGLGVTNIGAKIFYESSSVTTVNYVGTSEQWAQIVKDSNWDKYAEYTLVCLGDIKEEEKEDGNGDNAGGIESPEENGDNTAE